MPALSDVHFSQALIYVCAHNAEGTMGIMVNRPILDINLAEVLTQLDILTTTQTPANMPVLLGGPVQPERGFIIHRSHDSWQSTLTINEDISVTSSQDILQAMADGQGPKDAVVILGYAGWGAGQIEAEIANNFWLTAPADPHIIFNVPFEQRWRAAVKSLGIDVANIADDVGHA